jgi:hypothetical protein
MSFRPGSRINYSPLAFTSRTEIYRIAIVWFTGWDEGSEKYSVLAETEDSRSNFADNVLKFLVFYGFDGVRPNDNQG